MTTVIWTERDSAFARKYFDAEINGVKYDVWHHRDAGKCRASTVEKMIRPGDGRVFFSSLGEAIGACHREAGNPAVLIEIEGNLVDNGIGEEKTVVVFRKWKDNGAIIALFPFEKDWESSPFCVSYMHNGQHGDADYDHVISKTVRATPEEYEDLRMELENFVGYDLVIRERRPVRQVA